MTRRKPIHGGSGAPSMARTVMKIPYSYTRPLINTLAAWLLIHVKR
jgi:hypothetical protein